MMELNYVNHIWINRGEEQIAKVTLTIERSTGLAVVMVHMADNSDRFQVYYLPTDEANDTKVIRTKRQAEAFMYAVQLAVIESLNQLDDIWTFVTERVMLQYYEGTLALDQVEITKMGGNLVAAEPPTA